MLKQVPIRLEEEFVLKIKMICLVKGMTFQDAAKVSLEKWVKDNESSLK